MLRLGEWPLVPGGRAILQIGTTGQADAIQRHLLDTGVPLTRGETRVFERGVLVELVRDAAASG